MATTVDNSTQKVSQSLMDAMNPKKTTKGTTEEAQDKFMTLLVTQMRNQDPLNPLDNAQVTSQLAQLSTVTGIEKLNKALETLQGSYQASQQLQATAMIGHGVLVPGDKIDVAEGKGVFGIDLSGPADKVSVTIKDAVGNVVRTVDLGSKEAGSYPVAWDGKDDKGNTVADGKYQFSVSATQGDAKADVTALSFDAVTSVSTAASGVKINLVSKGAVALGDIRQIL